jgi:hypothetical protein
MMLNVQSKSEISKLEIFKAFILKFRKELIILGLNFILTLPYSLRVSSIINYSQIYREKEKRYNNYSSYDKKDRINSQI